MKRVILNIIIGLVALLLFTCNEQPDKILYKGPDFVFLDSKPQISLYENQKTPLAIACKVSLAQAANTQVTFEIIGENVLAGSDYKVQTTSPLQITRGQFGSTILIQPVDNNIIQPESRKIRVRILSIDNPALSAQVVKEVEIDLLEDDCLPTVPKVSLWVGNVSISGAASASTTGKAEGGAGGICGGSLAVNGNFFGATNPASAMTILMTQSETVPTKGVASVVRFPLFEGNSNYDYEASGSYDETTKIITLNFTLYNNSDHTQDFTGTHIITPK